ncbi:MAG TPA: hypothetical protein VGI73_03290 [Solirubrobacterales bacterium]|jgi:hypothetical protein
MADRRELKEAEDRGRRIGQFEQVAFRVMPSVGTWLPEVRFTFFVTWSRSLADHGRRLVDNLREIQRVRWLLKHDPEAAPLLPPPHSPSTLLRLEQEYEAEAWKVRTSIGEFLDEGCGRACVAAALHAIPQRPATAIEYDDAAAFVAEDGRRGTIYPTHVALRPDASFGIDWRLENPFRRWETTSWSIGWLCGPSKEMREAGEGEPWFEEDERAANATHEVYAVESLDASNPFAEDGRVWVLGTLQRHASLDRALREMRLHAIHDRNSLVAAADAIAVAQREEAREGAWVQRPS